jgi:hypothetical protein
MTRVIPRSRSSSGSIDAPVWGRNDTRVTAIPIASKAAISRRMKVWLGAGY